MNISGPFIRRPVMTAVLTLSVILFGVMSYTQLPVNDLPAVDYPQPGGISWPDLRALTTTALAAPGCVGITKDQMKIVVPVLLHNQRLAAGPEVFEGVIGGANYYWGMEDTIPSAKTFNDAFRKANGGAIPTDYGAYGYTGVMSLLLAMQAAGGTDTNKMITALEDLKYDVAKGPQHYRKCDHQSVQSVLVLESKKKSEMKNNDDLFKIVTVEPASESVLRTCAELGFPT